MDMNLQKYISFVKTAEYGSFTKAAQILNYSQSSISRMINDLENECNITLLERSAAGVTLTSDGTELLPYAKSVVCEFEKLQMKIDDLNGLHSGLVRIATISSIATHIIPNIIKRFQKDYPNIDYELLVGHYADIENWVSEGSADCGFLRTPSRQGFKCKNLKRDELLTVLSKNHPLASYEKFPIKALADYPFILLEKEEKEEISQIFEKNHIVPDIHIRTIDDYAVMSMAEQGLGISILPKLILKRCPYDIVTKKLDIPAYRNLSVIISSERTPSLAVSRFLDYIDND